MNPPPLLPLVVACIALSSPPLGTAQSIWQTPVYESYSVRSLAGVRLRDGSYNGVGAHEPAFSRPEAVAVDASGNIYVQENDRHSIQKITPDGERNVFVGSAQKGSNDGDGTEARFFLPKSLAIDAAGNLYVADLGNHTIRKVTPAGAVTTLAGAAGVSGSADGAAANARFNEPHGVAVDNAGNVYVADTNNYTVRKITSAGVVSTLAGLPGAVGTSDGTGTAARFNLLLGIAVDEAGNVFVADASTNGGINGTIRKITSTGEVTTFAGRASDVFGDGFRDGTGTAARFNGPVGLAIGPNGNIYVADTWNQTIRMITPAAVVTSVAPPATTGGFVDGSTSNARFNWPTGVVVDATGNIYVADRENGLIRKIDPSANVSTYAGIPGFFYHPQGIAVDDEGTAYVADTGNRLIRKITSHGAVSTLAGSGKLPANDGTGTNAGFSEPHGVAVDGARNVYVADGYRIRKITAEGVVSTFAGADVSGTADGPGDSARFMRAIDVASDNAGNLYVVDLFTIRKITPDRVVTTIAGLANSWGSADGQGSAARFYHPSGIAVDGAGNLYVADYENRTVRKITPDGTVSTLAGLAGNGGRVDATGSAARFEYPVDVAVDSSGTVYVSDRGNALLRKITPAGKVTTVAGTHKPFAAPSDGRGSHLRITTPHGLALDHFGNIFFAENFSSMIRIAQPYTAVSRKVHAATAFDVDLPISVATGVEPRAGGTPGEYQVIVTGYGPVTFDSASVSSSEGNVSSASGAGSATLIFNLSGVANQQTLALTIFGVNDGAMQRDVVIPMSVLVGDATGDGIVNSGDALRTRARSGQTTDATNFRSDVNADGAINGGDAFIVRARSGQALP